MLIMICTPTNIQKSGVLFISLTVLVLVNNIACSAMQKKPDSYNLWAFGTMIAVIGQVIVWFTTKVDWMVAAIAMGVMGLSAQHCAIGISFRDVLEGEKENYDEKYTMLV